MFGHAMGRIALPLATALMALAFALPGHAGALFLFPLAMMCCGAATGLTDVLMNARVSVIEADRDMPLMNLCHAAYSFGYAGAAIATGAMRAAEWPPGTVMGTVSAITLLFAVLAIERDGTIRGLARPKEGPGASLGILPLIGGGIVLIAFMTENAAENWSALHIEKTLGGSPAEGSMGPAVLAITMGIARLVGQGFAARIAPLRLLSGGALIAGTGALVASAATSPAMAYAGFIVMGIGASVIAPTAFSLVGQFAPPEARARAVARATLWGYFGYFFGPPTLGMIAGAFGLRFAFVFAAAMLMCVLVLAPLMLRHSRRAVA
jgi:predicted MFS family arabinose efflux permease